MKKQKKWMKFRHKVITKLASWVLYPYTRLKYHIKIEKFREQGNRQYLVIMNHQTAFDQFFVGFAFRGPVYYIASEDLFSNGFISTLLRYAVAPIPIKKQTTDISAVKNCIRVAREGGTIALAPEGNRTYSGKTEYMKPAIAKLVKALKLPLAIFRIEGGYGVHPRWSDVVRRGSMRAYVSKVVEPEDYKGLSDTELMDMIQRELYVDEGQVTGEFHHKELAQYLERAMYVCPDCGLTTFESHGDVITCKTCNKQIRYLPTKELEGVNCSFPFRFVTEWYEYQCDFINNLDYAEYVQIPAYRDKAALYRVILNKNKELLDEDVQLCLYGDRITLKGAKTDLLVPFDSAQAVTVLGRNKLNMYLDGDVYQIKSGKRFNALKYVNFFHRYKNCKEGNEDGKFLGL